MFTDVDMPELQLLQDAYLLTFLSCALILKALTELLFPFPGDLARARRTCVVILLLLSAASPVYYFL